MRNRYFMISARFELLPKTILFICLKKNLGGIIRRASNCWCADVQNNDKVLILFSFSVTLQNSTALRISQRNFYSIVNDTIYCDKLNLGISIFRSSNTLEVMFFSNYIIIQWNLIRKIFKFLMKYSSEIPRWNPF